MLRPDSCGRIAANQDLAEIEVHPKVIRLTGITCTTMGSGALQTSY